MTAADPGAEGALPLPRSGIRALGHLAPDYQARKGSLLRAELVRFRARRLIVVLVLLGLAGLVADGVGQWVNHEKPTAAAYAAATAKRDAMVERVQADCRTHVPADQVDEICGGITRDMPAEAFLAHQPFAGATGIPEGVQAVGAGLALLGFLLGATFVGAEWSTRNMAALLTWRPRRLHVMGTKFFAALLWVTAIAVVAEALWLGAGALIMHSRGVATGTGGDFWRDTSAMAVRAVGLAAFGTAIGFAIAMLIRNTGAALGVAFAYFALGEALLRHLRPQLNPYLLISQFDAWLHNGGAQVQTGNGSHEWNGFTVPFMHLSTPRAGLTLCVYAAILLGIAAISFRRRDIA